MGSIIRERGQAVWGVVYQVCPEDLKRLDQREGVFVYSYHRERIVVTCGIGQEFTVWTHFAVPQENPPIHHPPGTEYLAHYIRGAEHFGLPVEYIMELKSIET